MSSTHTQRRASWDTGAHALGRCETCGKIRFASRAEAKRAIREMRGRGTSSTVRRVYRCGDYWHITSVSASQQAAIKREDHRP